MNDMTDYSRFQSNIPDMDQSNELPMIPSLPPIDIVIPDDDTQDGDVVEKLSTDNIPFEGTMVVVDSNSPRLPYCRICLDDTPDNMIRDFCGCKEGASFAHLQCILQWIYTSHKPKTDCEICRQPFDLNVIQIDKDIDRDNKDRRIRLDPNFYGYRRGISMDIVPVQIDYSQESESDSENGINSEEESRRANRRTCLAQCLGTSAGMILIGLLGTVSMSYNGQGTYDAIIFSVVSFAIMVLLCFRHCFANNISISFFPHSRQQQR